MANPLRSEKQVLTAIVPHRNLLLLADLVQTMRAHAPTLSWLSRQQSCANTTYLGARRQALFEVIQVEESRQTPRTAAGNDKVRALRYEAHRRS